MSMRACLVSPNTDVAAVLQQCEGITWVHSQLAMPMPEASLYIWDFEQNIEIPVEILGQEETQHLLLADLGQLERLDAPLTSSVGIMLKPATPFTLRAFVEMAVKTWNLRRQVREADTLRHDRDALLQYVLEVNLKLQEYDRERSDFFVCALHDLRAPLTALHGYCGLLAEGKLGYVNAQQRELLERMCYSTNRLGRLASGIFEMLTQGRVVRTPKFTAGDIEGCVNRALHDVYPFLQDKNIEVVTQLDPLDQVFCFEAEHIEQVLVNLLENSCKFSQRNGRIEVRGYLVTWDFELQCEHEDQDGTNHKRWINHNNKQVPGAPGAASVISPQLPAPAANAYRIDVIDSGSGVPEHLVEKIFEQYASYSGSLDRSGGGLGLAICKLIIAAHRGVIWAKPSENGGCFSFVLPLRLPAAESSLAFC